MAGYRTTLRHYQKAMQMMKLYHRLLIKDKRASRRDREELLNLIAKHRKRAALMAWRMTSYRRDLSDGTPAAV